MKGRILISAVLVLTSCAFDDQQIHDPELRLMFQPEMYMHVSQEGSEGFPTEESFAVCAWKNGDQEYLPLSEARSSEVTISEGPTNTEVKDTLWLISDELKWPPVNEHLSFLAFSPYAADCECNLSDGISFKADILKEQNDILFTHPHSDRHKVENGWVVPLQFSHAFCKVDFRIKNRVTDQEEITIKRIAMEGAFHKGNFSSLRTPQWQTEGEMAEIVFFEGSCPTGNLPEKIGEGLLMIPQQLGTRLKIAYDYTTIYGSKLSMDLETSTIMTEMEAGYSYTYTLSVGIDDVKLIQEVIGDRFK